MSDGRHRASGPDGLRRRVAALSVIASMGFLVVVGQLWYLQILEGPRLAGLSERNRIWVRPLPSPRGTLYDRNLVPLAETGPAFTVSVIPRELEHRPAVLARLAILLKVPVSELEAPVRERANDSRWPVRLRRGLSFDEAIRVQEWRGELPGVVVEVEPQRSYPSSRFAAHLLGYVRQAPSGPLGPGPARAGSSAGQSGLERLFDELLKGRDGGEEVEVDTFGLPVRVIRREEPQPGASVVTTIDRRIQEAAERALGDATGAIVVMDPRNGDVLAMVSSPAFELERLSGPMEREEWLRVVKDPRHPLLNRAFQGLYPPGSLFKVVVAAAALEEGTITPVERLSCPASLEIGGRTFRNWTDADQGWMDLRRALAMSCNTVFYRVGLKVGIERIARYAKAFGLGEPTGIALGGERVGSVPTPALKWESLGQPWRPGDTANVSIGQGRVLVTPVQVARLMAAIANGGTLWRPRLVREVIGATGPLVSIPPEARGRVPVSASVLSFLQASLWAAVNEGGTGSAAAVARFAVAGKTGTAQTMGDGGSSRGLDHAWFAGYAPVEDPRVVVVVLVERGGAGGKVAAPLARQILLEILPSLAGGAGDRPA